MKIAKAIVILYFLGTTNPLEGQETNLYLKIAERNAFELTAGQPKLILPPAAEILKPNLYLTGITHFKGARKVHLVLKRAGELNKFVSLSTNKKQYNIKLIKINKNTVLISNNGHNELLSFENNSLPTIISKAAPPKKESKSDMNQNERRPKYDEWKKRREAAK